MTVEHCMVNGERCTKCCQVILLNKRAFSYAWSRYVRLPNYDIEHTKKVWGTDSFNILTMLKPIKKRLAKKLNPHVFKNRAWVKNTKFYTCRHLTDNGCGNYEGRPNMCSEYPYYGKTKEQWEEQANENGVSPYDPDCTFFINVKTIYS